MLHRIRANQLQDYTPPEFDEICEVDETYVGGANKNRHSNKKVKNAQGRSTKVKTPIFGIMVRGESEFITRPHKQQPHKNVRQRVITKYSRVITVVTPNTAARSLLPIINMVVPHGNIIVSDEHSAYNKLHRRYSHWFIQHKKKEYVSSSIPIVNTNSIESFWAIIKRSYKGVYNWYSRKHMQKYANEYAWRFNNRGKSPSERFNSLLLNGKRRIKYRDLINGRA